MSLREEFVQLAGVEGANLSALCRQFGIGRRTGYRWLRRFEHEGLSGLEDRSRTSTEAPTSPTHEPNNAPTERSAAPLSRNRPTRRAAPDPLPRSPARGEGEGGGPTSMHFFLPVVGCVALVDGRRLTVTPMPGPASPPPRGAL